MILPEEKYELDGKEILLRSARENADDANMLIDYLKTVTGETRFLIREPDEVKCTTEGELNFILVRGYIATVYNIIKTDSRDNLCFDMMEKI